MSMQQKQESMTLQKGENKRVNMTIFNLHVVITFFVLKGVLLALI